MKFKFLYTIPLIILCLLVAPNRAIAKEFIGKVITVDKNNTEIKVEIYNNSHEGFSWARFFGFENQNDQAPKIIIIKLTKNNINNISQGSFLRLIGEFKKNKEFILKKLQVLPRDPTGVRERLGLIRRERRTTISHKTRPHITRPHTAVHTHTHKRPVTMRPHQGGRHR